MKYKKLIINIIIPLLVGGISSLLTYQNMSIYQTINQPPLAPPSWLFPIVWTLLYILMGISSYYVYISNSAHKETALIVYFFQLLINFVWPIIFFNYQNYLLALLDLIVLIILVIMMIYIFKMINITSGYLNIPYLIWLLFALYLNFYIFIYN